MNARRPLITAGELDFGPATSTPVISGAQKFLIPVPVLAGGGEPLVYPDGERAGQPVLDWSGRPAEGRGLVFFNADDRSYQVVRGDGSGVVVIGLVGRDEARRLDAKIAALGGPAALTLAKIKEVLAYARHELGLRAIYDTDRDFVARKMSKIGDAGGVPAYGLHKRDERDICRAVYVPGAGAFRGPAATPQQFGDGAVIVKQGGDVRLVQPDAFEASYTHADGRRLRVSELAVQRLARED